jgi:hypothetical protein
MVKNPDEPERTEQKIRGGDQEADGWCASCPRIRRGTAGARALSNQIARTPVLGGWSPP